MALPHDYRKPVRPPEIPQSWDPGASQPGESHVRKAYALLAGSLDKLGRTGEALSATLKGLSEVGDDPELHYRAALYLTEMKRFAEARQHYEAIREDIGDHFSSIDIAILTFKRFHNLGSVCMLMDDYPAAKAAWTRALEYAPRFLPSAMDLFNAALSVGDFQAARSIVDHLRAATGPSEQWAITGSRYYEAVTGPNESEGFLRRAVHENPYALGPRLVFARRLLGSGREEEARDHLETLEQFGVAEAAFFLGIHATRKGDFQSAIAWMERAHELNPQHEDTKVQLQGLRQAVQAVGENV